MCRGLGLLYCNLLMIAVGFDVVTFDVDGWFSANLGLVCSFGCCFLACRCLLGFEFCDLRIDDLCMLGFG